MGEEGRMLLVLPICWKAVSECLVVVKEGRKEGTVESCSEAFC
jgi:hypothetical protein